MDMGDGGDMDGMGDMGDMSNMTHGMSMYFHWGYNETVLFDTWKISTVGGLVGSVFGIIIMAALYEGLKYYRDYLLKKTANTITDEHFDNNKFFHPKMFSMTHGFQCFLHAAQIILSYFLMLIFMTYNIWLCLAIVLGAVIGYFLFGWRKSFIVDVTEHCH